MTTSKLITPVFFYVMGLTRCNKIENDTYTMHSDRISNETEQTETDQSSYYNCVADLTKLDQLVKDFNEKQQEQKQEKELKHNRKRSQIAPSIALKILNMIMEDTEVGASSISNRLFEDEKVFISNATIMNFLKRKNLENSCKRHKAKESGDLEKMIGEIK